MTLVIKAIATTRTEGERVKDSISRTSEGGHHGGATGQGREGWRMDVARHQGND